PDQQGKGRSDKLLRHAEGFACSLGLSEIRLYTNAAFASNLDFYSRRGYAEFLRETRIPGSVTVHMAKRLVGAGWPRQTPPCSFLTCRGGPRDRHSSRRVSSADLGSAATAVAILRTWRGSTTSHSSSWARLQAGIAASRRRAPFSVNQTARRRR